MAMKRCGACGHKYRGKGSRVTVLRGKASEQRIVCPPCSAKASPVLAPENAFCHCGQPAEVCLTCMDKVEAREQKAVVKDLVKKLEGQLKARRLALSPASDPEASGYVEGLESAIEQLRRAT